MKIDWRKVPKEVKKLYNLNAEKQNKKIKEYYASNITKVSLYL